MPSTKILDERDMFVSRAKSSRNVLMPVERFSLFSENNCFSQADFKSPLDTGGTWGTFCILHLTVIWDKTGTSFFTTVVLVDEPLGAIIHRDVSGNRYKFKLIILIMWYNSVFFIVRKAEILTQHMNSPTLLTKQCQSLFFTMISKWKEVAVKI